ncbi:hypothetical protein ACFLRM_02030 [Acidobacteriota bacterium]
MIASIILRTFPEMITTKIKKQARKKRLIHWDGNDVIVTATLQMAIPRMHINSH